MPTPGFKILTEDFCPPLQGGSPLFTPNTEFPLVLPETVLDTSDSECGAGWNFCEDLDTAFKIIKICGKYGLNRAFRVVGDDTTIKRGDKLRCKQLTIIGECEAEDFRGYQEPSGKQTEFLEWMLLEKLPFNEEQLIKALQISLEIKKLTRWEVVLKQKSDYNSYYNYNYNYYNYYNYYNSYCYNNYNYYNYIPESFLEPDKQFRDSLKLAYQMGMRQLRFDEKNRQLLVWLKSELPQD